MPKTPRDEPGGAWTSCAAAGQANAVTRNSSASEPIRAVVTGRVDGLGDDHRVAREQRDVLLQVLAAGDVLVVELEPHRASVLGPEDRDVLGVRVWVSPPISSSTTRARPPARTDAS